MWFFNLFTYLQDVLSHKFRKNYSIWIDTRLKIFLSNQWSFVFEIKLKKVQKKKNFTLVCEKIQEWVMLSAKFNYNRAYWLAVIKLVAFGDEVSGFWGLSDLIPWQAASIQGVFKQWKATC